MTESPVSGKKLTPSEAFAKICQYCAYQERSHLQVRNKLLGYGLYRSDAEELISKLIVEGFLNEERFAKAFAGGKFRIKKWGRNKISHELESHFVTDRCIQKGLDEIDEGEYRNTLKSLLKKKFGRPEKTGVFNRRNKAAKYAIGKGYEPELVWRMLKEMK